MKTPSDVHLVRLEATAREGPVDGLRCCVAPVAYWPNF